MIFTSEIVLDPACSFTAEELSAMENRIAALMTERLLAATIAMAERMIYGEGAVGSRGFLS